MPNDANEIANLYAKMRAAETAYAAESEATWPQELPPPPKDYAVDLIGWGMVVAGLLSCVAFAYCVYWPKYR